ncbi:MAG: universal stress protein [Oligoflexia bacterium]|nr:universal stress protein [Oligoflexia bacterium]
MQKIIWAIDPFEEKGEVHSHVLSMLQDLSSRGALIEPVYVLSPDEYDMNVAFNAPWLKKLRPTVDEVLAHYLKDVKVAGLGKPQVVIEKRPSFTRSIKALTAYAKQRKADSILVGTHSKQGASRLLLGSFAETLLLYSKVPVLVVGPRSEISRPDSRIEHILFSTDFGLSSYSIFKKVLALAKGLSSNRHVKITLFHCLPHAVEPFFQSGVFLLGGGVISFPDFVTQDEEKKRRLALRYMAAAEKLGIELEIEFNPGRGGAAQAIVDRARSGKADLIAMASQTSAVPAALIGSVTRQVIRSAPCPVWVLHV